MVSSGQMWVEATPAVSFQRRFSTTCLLEEFDTCPYGLVGVAFLRFPIYWTGQPIWMFFLFSIPLHEVHVLGSLMFGCCQSCLIHSLTANRYLISFITRVQPVVCFRLALFVACFGSIFMSTNGTGIKQLSHIIAHCWCHKNMYTQVIQ